eukprot:2481255-Pleurochrysis_carterae.AAC.3
MQGVCNLDASSKSANSQTNALKILRENISLDIFVATCQIKDEMRRLARHSRQSCSAQMRNLMLAHGQKQTTESEFPKADKCTGAYACKDALAELHIKKVVMQTLAKLQTYASG